MRTLISLAAGIAGGIAGSMLIGGLMKRQGALPEPLRGPALRAHPGGVIAGKIEEVTGGMSEETKGRLANLAHFAYGLVGPMAIGALASRLRPGRSIGRALLTGAALGTLVWAAGHVGWLPAIGLAEPVRRQGASHVASSIAGHVLAYGLPAALPVALADRWMA
jgi:hypothetical protein